MEKRINLYKRFLCVCCILPILFLISGCSGKTDIEETQTPEDITIFYEADSGAFKKDTSSDYSKTDTMSPPPNGKTIISLVCGGAETRTITGLINSFNKENDIYYVEMVQHPYDMDFSGKQERLKVDVATGKGPDIMTTDIFPVTEEIISKEYLVDLSPLMEKSGITDERYFPAYRCLTDGDKIYGLCPSMDVIGMSIDGNILPNKQIPDLETLVDILLAYPEPAIFLNDSQEGIHIMDYFLCGSKNLWGMIDWENKSCDFSTELFSKILEVSKKYADNRNKGYSPIIRSTFCYIGLYPGREALEKEGRVILDYYFDDGNYPKYNASVETLVINANTNNLEGAWAFLSYAMNKTGQSYYALPTHKDLFTEMNLNLLKDIEDGKAYPMVDFTEAVMQDAVQVFSTGKYCPQYTEEIMDIIHEESGAYFSGDKNKEGVINIIQNRVTLLLEE